MKPAVFLDRDGVLVEDVHLVTHRDQLRLLPGVPGALRRLRDAGYALIVVTNQPVIARGLCGEAEVELIHAALDGQLKQAGGAVPDHYYFCPHHPNADVAAYRVDCDCRKPKPGMLLRAAREFAIDLKRSIMVGDRLTDIAAGRTAGCRTVWVQTGRHLDPPIATTAPVHSGVSPDHVCADLPAATGWILDSR